MATQVEDVVSEKVNSLLGNRTTIKLLEAGCGSATHIRFNPEVKSVGIDISREQLERNTVIQEKILGDIQTYPLPEAEFDIVICWEVLEHLPRPKEALLNMFKTVKPDGLVILAFPNLISFKGLATKYTPHWFHRFAYQLMKYKSRPFPTYFRWAIIPSRVRGFAEEHGLTAVSYNLSEGRFQRRVRDRFRTIDWAFAAVNSLLRVASFGKFPSLYNDACFLILRKKEQMRHLETAGK
jgi:SAM-dependent methyltransferase